MSGVALLPGGASLLLPGGASLLLPGGTATPATSYFPVVTVREPRTAIVKEGRIVQTRNYTYRSVDEDPAIAFQWLDGSGATVDTSSATWAMELTPIVGGTTVTKTGGFDGSSTGTNVIAGWSTGELATLYATAQAWSYTITATIGGRERTVPVRGTIFIDP